MINIDIVYHDLFAVETLELLLNLRKSSSHGRAANAANPKAERTVSCTFPNLIIITL